jgi:hypothetical protein
VDRDEIIQKLCLCFAQIEKIYREPDLEHVIRYLALELYGHPRTQRQEHANVVAVCNFTLPENKAAGRADIAESSRVPPFSVLVLDLQQQSVS